MKKILLFSAIAVFAYIAHAKFPENLTIDKSNLMLVGTAMTISIIAICMIVYTYLNNMEKRVGQSFFKKSRKSIIKSANASIVILLTLLALISLNFNNLIASSILYSLPILAIAFLTSILFDMLNVFFAIKPFED